MAVTCPNCNQGNPDGESTCSLCGKLLPSHEKTWAGPMPAEEREVTQTDPIGPRGGGEATGSMEHDFRGVVVGGRVANRYVVKEMLGRGGNAMVFRATDESLGEEIALKLFPDLSRQGGAELERFKREILVNRRISHVNVIRVHDFGTVGDDAFLTMELLRGGTLAEKIEEKALPITEAVEIAIGISEGLHAAHQAGIVHRDVKPENVLFDDAGRPKLSDFGLARLVDSNTQTRGFSGTPFYMSPEQAEGREITTQTDVYSLGVLLFELFTGQLPFFADSLVRIAMLHANEIPPRPAELRPGVPPALEQLVLACLAKTPEARPQGAGSVAASLRKFRRDGGLDAAKKLDADPSFTSLKRDRRARLQAPSDRIDLGAKNPARGDDRTLDRITSPSGARDAAKETVIVRVNAGEGPSAARRAAAVPRPESSAPRPPPDTAKVRPRDMTELPLPGGSRRGLVITVAAVAGLAVAGVAGFFLLPAFLGGAPGTPSASPTQVAGRSPTPTPHSTPVEVLAGTPTAAVERTPTPRPTAGKTPRATPTAVAERTPKPVQTSLAIVSPTQPLVKATPTPTPKEVGFGKVVVKAMPWATVYVDGEKRGEGPVVTVPDVTAGSHTIRIENVEKNFSRQVEFRMRAGQTCSWVGLVIAQNPALKAIEPGC